jgi:hypothetical protein
VTGEDACSIYFHLPLYHYFFHTFFRHYIGKHIGKWASLLFILFLLPFTFIPVIPANASTATFEDLSLASESYWNGSDGTGGFSSNGIFFNNNYDPNYLSWAGFAYSNRTNTIINDWGNSQYNAITGGGAEGSKNYCVGYYNVFPTFLPTVTFPDEEEVVGAYFTNTNYAYYSMLNGDAFAKKFEQGDWFKLTITGRDAQGAITRTIDVYLAEDANIVNTWKWKDLGSLGRIKSLEFSLSSTDNGPWGMNTPAYFCMDNLVLLSPEKKGGCFIENAGRVFTK